MIVRTNVPVMLPLPPVQLCSTATPEPVSLIATWTVPSLPARSVWDIQAVLAGNFNLAPNLPAGKEDTSTLPLVLHVFSAIATEPDGSAGRRDGRSAARL